MAGRGSRRSARTEVGALERASADAAERRAVTLRKLWRAVVGTRSAGGVNPTAVSQRVRIPPGNCRSSRKQSERCREVTNCTEALR